MSETKYLDTPDKETYCATYCSSCGGDPNESKVSVVGTPMGWTHWVCECGQKNRLVYHQDDCPCTLGGPCELEYEFETPAKSL